MVDCQDDTWLDCIARQYEIAFAAYGDTLDCAARAIAGRLGHESIEQIDRALCLDRRATRDERKPWLDKIIALNQEVRALMGNGYWRLDERLSILSRAADDCAEEIGRLKTWTAEDSADTLTSYLCDRREGYSGTFSAWLRMVQDDQGAPLPLA